MNIEKTIENLRKNAMQAFFVKDKKAAVSKISELLSEGDVVSVGGSMTLFEAGIIEHLRCGKYRFLDRYAEGLSGEDIGRLYRETFSADAYLCSSNAVTENGELYNVDGNGNRVAAILFGPKSVIITVGKNKIVKNLDEAVERVKKIAAPKNVNRLSLTTYCSQKGECMGVENGAGGMCRGCASEGRICSQYTVCGHQRIKDRIKVIIVDEELGY